MIKLLDIIFEAGAMGGGGVAGYMGENDDLDEMPIKRFQTVGDWERRSSFGDVDRRILTSPIAVEKIKRQWENTPFNFEMYLVNDPRVNKSQFREVGLVDMNFVRYRMGITKDEIPKPDENAITIIFTSNTGAERYMASGWILAHRLGHALARGENAVSKMWRRFIEGLRKKIEDILSKVYGIDVRPQPMSYTNYYYDFKAARDKEKILKYVAQEIGTMKSARDKKMRTWFEFAYELLAQYLLTGKITFNPFPKELLIGFGPYGRKQTRYSRDEESRETVNLEELENIASEIQNDLEYILDAAVGSVFVM
jgi:hypothetical protein